MWLNHNDFMLRVSWCARKAAEASVEMLTGRRIFDTTPLDTKQLAPLNGKGANPADVLGAPATRQGSGKAGEHDQPRDRFWFGEGLRGSPGLSGSLEEICKTEIRFDRRGVVGHCFEKSPWLKASKVECDDCMRQHWPIK
jgi:hypothetical protein